MYQVRGQLDSAFLVTDKGLSLLSKLKEKSNEKAGLLLRKGYILQGAGDITASINALRQAFQIYKHLKNKARQVATLTAIGYAYYLNGDFTNADKVYQQALQIIPANDAGFIHAELILSLGNNAQSQKKYTLAKKYYDQAYQLFEGIENILGQCKIQLNIGLMLREEKKYGEALQYLEKAKRKIVSNPSSYLHEYLDYAAVDIYIQQKNFKEAEKRLMKSDKRAQTATLKMDYFRLRYMLDSAQANYRQAMQWYIKYRQLDDSLKNRKKELLMDILKIQYVTRRNDQIPVTSSASQQPTSFWQGKGLFLSIALLVLLGTLVFLYYLYRKKNLAYQKLLQVADEAKSTVLENQAIDPTLEKSIAEKDHELTVQAMHLLRKNQALEHILKNLKQWTKNSKAQDKGDIQDLIKYLKKQVDSEDDWKQFHHSFEIAHPGFYNRLQTKHPTLTEYDLKLGALIRLGLDTSELAIFLNITMDSVRKARFRLRKKLDLQDEQLNDYLRNS